MSEENKVDLFIKKRLENLNFKFKEGEIIYYSDGLFSLYECDQGYEDEFFSKAVIKKRKEGQYGLQYIIEDIRREGDFTIDEGYCYKTKREMFEDFDKWGKDLKQEFEKRYK